MENVEMLYDLCGYISDEIETANDKIRTAGGKLTAGDVDYIDKLTHALKSIKTTIAMVESENEYSNGDGMYPDGGSYRDGMRGGSYARGRGSSVRRDRMGRYSREGGYSRAEGVKDMLRQAMDDAATEREREAIRKALKELER